MSAFISMLRTVGKPLYFGTQIAILGANVRGGLKLADSPPQKQHLVTTRFRQIFAPAVRCHLVAPDARHYARHLVTRSLNGARNWGWSR